MRTSITRFLTAAVSVAALCTGAAACGSTDNEAASTESSASVVNASYDTSSIGKDETIAALVPQKLKDKGTLTVGMDTTYAPAEFLDEDGRTPIGYDVDMVKAMAALMGLKADPVTSTFDLIIPSVGSKYDLGVSSFTITNERKQAVDFVSFYKAGSTWAVPKGNPDKIDTSDLCGRKVAVQTGTTQEDELAAMNSKCVADGKQPIEVLSSKQQTDVTTNVVTGKASAFYADSPVAGYAIKQTDGALEKLGEDTGVAEQGIVVDKGNEELDRAVQAAMQKLMDDGTYNEILSAWGVTTGAIDKAEINPDAA